MPLQCRHERRPTHQGRQPDPSDHAHHTGTGTGSRLRQTQHRGVAARTGVGKHTIYRRWPSKGALFLDAVLTSGEPGLDYPDTGDVVADLRQQIHAAVDLLGQPPLGPFTRP
ncbi:hypothetical protein GCM10027614_80270 [Micromonospora vulcania]